LAGGGRIPSHPFSIADPEAHLLHVWPELRANQFLLVHCDHLIGRLRLGPPGAWRRSATSKRISGPANFGGHQASVKRQWNRVVFPIAWLPATTSGTTTLPTSGGRGS